METELDRIDYEIVDCLQNNARLSNKELAARIGLAPSSCLSRVRRLEQRGVLQGYTAKVDPSVAGIGLQALISVRVHQHSLKIYEELRESLLARPEVLSFYHLAGQDDFLVHVGVVDADHLRSLAWEAFTARPEVAQIYTSLLYEHTTSPVRRLEKPKPAVPSPAKKRRGRSKPTSSRRK